MDSWQTNEDADDPRRASSVAVAVDLHKRLADADLRGLLADAFNRLNATEPQVSFTVDVADRSGPATWDWVPTQMIVETNYPQWGRFDYDLEDVPYETVAELADADTDPVDWLDETLRYPSYPVKLLCWPGWHGPIYTLNGDGNHRVHTARALGLPYLPCLLSTHGAASAHVDIGIAPQS